MVWSKNQPSHVRKIHTVDHTTVSQALQSPMSLPQNPAHFPSPSTSRSRICRHTNLRPRTPRILTLPETRDSLKLRIKIQPGFPVKRVRPPTSHGLLIPRKRKHRQRHRNRDIDTDLPGFDFFLEPSGCGPVGGEDGYAVAVFIVVDEFDGVVEGGDVEADEHGAKDFFAVAFH